MKKMTGKSKAGIILLVLLLIAAIGAGSIYGISSFAKKNAIGADAAVNFALVDAGVLPEQARVDRVDFEYEHGRFVYEIEFVAEGVDYEYTIQAYTGEVLEKETEPVEGYVAPEKETPAEESSSAPEEPVEESSAPEPETTPSYITQAEAERIALENAGVTRDQVTFRKIKLDTEDGVRIFEVEFFSETTEYEYDINALTGEIISMDIERQPKESIEKSSAVEVAEESEVSEEPEISEEPEVSEEPEISEEPEPQPVSYISVEQAKQTALADAGLSSATFTKAKLEKDDGRVIYEIDFYAGNKEYEYDIDAFSGAILDRDIEVIEAEEEDDDDEDEDEDDD